MARLLAIQHGTDLPFILAPPEFHAMHSTHVVVGPNTIGNEGNPAHIVCTTCG